MYTKTFDSQNFSITNLIHVYLLQHDTIFKIGVYHPFFTFKSSESEFKTLDTRVQYIGTTIYKMLIFVKFGFIAQ